MATLNALAQKIQAADTTPKPMEITMLNSPAEPTAEDAAKAAEAQKAYDASNNVIFVNIENHPELKLAVVAAAEAADEKVSVWMRRIVAEKVGITIESTKRASSPKATEAKVDEALVKAVLFVRHITMMYGADSREAKAETKSLESRVKRMADGTKNKDGSVKEPGIGAEKAAAMLKAAQEKVEKTFSANAPAAPAA